MDNIRIKHENAEDAKLKFGAYTNDGRMVGYMQADLDLMQYTIEGIYVEPEYRGQNIATRLMDKFLEFIDGDIAMPCTMTFSLADGGTSLLGFMNSRYDFMVTGAGMSYQVKIGEIMKNSMVDHGLKQGIASDVRSLKKLGRKELNDICGELSARGFDRVSGAEELVKVYDTELSSVCIKDGDPTALILVKQLGNREAMIDFMYSKAKNVAAFETILRSVKAVYEADSEMELAIFTINETSEKLIDKLLENTDSYSKSETYIANWLMTPNLGVVDMMVRCGFFDEDEDDATSMFFPK